MKHKIRNYNWGMDKQTLQQELQQAGIPFSKRWGIKRLAALHEEYVAGTRIVDAPAELNNYNGTDLQHDISQLCSRIEHMALKAQSADRRKAKRLLVFRDKIQSQYQLLNQ